MFPKEDFESWNKLFPESKINENDLAHPTEAFLIKTLMHYLRAFGYKVDPPFPWHIDATENTREKRIFLAKLTRNIDHILKIIDKTYSFTYYDLIKPTPKKTSHILGILLNYLFYYNMYKTNVFGMASERIKERQELQKSIARNEQENERLQFEAKMCREDIAQMEKELPAVKEAVVKRKLERRNKNEYLTKLQSEVEELETKTKGLQEQKSHLEEELVPEVDLQKLQNERAKLKSEIDDLDNQETMLKNSLMERKTHINELQTMLSEVSSIKELVPLKSLQDLKDISQQHEELKKQLSVTKQNEQNLLQNIEKLKKSLKNVEDKSKNIRMKHEKEHAERLHAISNKENKISTLNDELSALREEEHALECALEEQTDIEDYLSKNLTEIMNFGTF